MRDHVMLSEFGTVRTAVRTGDVYADVRRLYLENDKLRSYCHVQGVAVAIRALALRFRLDGEACECAAYCHDIAAILAPQDMLRHAREHGLVLDVAEEHYPFLLHQRYSALIAEEALGVGDPRVLSAVACHSTLKTHPSQYDMALFLADKMSWDQEGIPPYLPIVENALGRSLYQASLAYIEYALESHMMLCPHRWLMEARQWLTEHCGSDAGRADA